MQAILNLAAIAGAGICFGLEYGSYVGMGVSFVTYALMPYHPKS